MATKRFTVAVFGAGRIGEAISTLLSHSDRYNVRLCDHDIKRASCIASSLKHVSSHKLKLRDRAGVLALLKNCNAVISALPYQLNLHVAKIAIPSGVHYFDLTEDVATTNAVYELAQQAKGCAMPQCGLAPGFISIAASYMANLFDTLDSIKLRVGALPIYPSNALKYNLTWSTDGLINEYVHDCQVIRAGVRAMARPLEGLEHFSLDGTEYEAFNTSGGLGSLCETLSGKVATLDYKTVRYPGHRELAAFLLNDLRFINDRETLKKVLERSLGFTTQDKCIVLVEAIGLIDNRLTQKTYASTIYNAQLHGRYFSAIQLTTASGVCAPLDLLLTGKLGKRRGLIKCENIPLLDFLANEFGRNYSDSRAIAGLSESGI